jgi:hypothetical protein
MTSMTNVDDISSPFSNLPAHRLRRVWTTSERAIASRREVASVIRRPPPALQPHSRRRHPLSSSLPARRLASASTREVASIEVPHSGGATDISDTRCTVPATPPCTRQILPLSWTPTAACVLLGNKISPSTWQLHLMHCTLKNNPWRTVILAKAVT